MPDQLQNCFGVNLVKIGNRELNTFFVQRLLRQLRLLIKIEKL